MILMQIHKIMMPFFRRQLKLLLIVLAVCALPLIGKAQTEQIQIQDATSNGAGLVSGGNYTGFVSAGQIATYMYANGTYIATQGIILNEISPDVEFTFELSGTLTENPDQAVGQLVLKSAAIDLQGTPLANVWVYLILSSDSTVYDSTMTDVDGKFVFGQVPYRNFFFTVNSPDLSGGTPPVSLAFEANPVFVKEVEINGEVGTDGIDANVALTPQLTTGGDNQETATWYLDADGDGFGDPKFTVKLNLNARQTGYVQNSSDCDDQDGEINPVAIDTPGSGIDANCDGFFTWYADIDEDGFGGQELVSSLNDYPMDGQSENNLDCDDSDPLINPDAIDVPGSGIDANCDGIVVECSGISEVMISAPLDPVQLGQQVDVDAVVVGDTPFSATWHWGDGAFNDGIISNENLTASHVYDSAGVYVLSLVLTDSCNSVSVYTHKYVVIYDPNGGFVTGSGNIYSPPGASTLYPNVDGFASFGFVSKYDKKKGIPKGNTEFEFDAGDLNFISNNYDWLVVSGSKAKFKGRGSINGEPGFQFMISAIDGDLNQKGEADIFRIKIWNELTQDVVYDNEMGNAIEADPTTQIADGSIVVHVPKEKGQSSVVASPNFGLETGITVTAYPNPTKGKIKLDIQSSRYELIEFFVTNISGQIVLRKEARDTPLVELDLSGNTAGMYYIRTRVGDENFVNKIILQHR